MPDQPLSGRNAAKEKTMSRFLIAGLATVLIATPALAQQSSAPGTLGGPPVPGVCMLSTQALIANAKIGQAAKTRLKEIADQIQAELTPEGTAIDSDAKALESERASLKAADYQARAQAINSRVAAFQQKRNLRDRQFQVTDTKATREIMRDAQPVIGEVYKAHNCGLLLDRNVVLDGNFSGDLTAEVVQGLDAKVTTITFDLEPPPAPGAAVGAGAAPAGN
jgi:Skp family chaperone for outer membrane proteins